MAETALKFKLYARPSAAGTGSSDAQTVPFDTFETFSSGLNYSASSGEITVNDAGNYLIQCDVTTDETSGNNRSEVEIYLEVDKGAGFSLVSGSEGRIYSRNTTEGAGTASFTLPLAMASGDAIRVRYDSHDTIQHQSKANACRLTLMLVDPTEASGGGGTTLSRSRV